ncbi:PREDICTED: uncharacterized protein LOC106330935 [Brassica oleracea var. oleracea]|uniref:uncharacterized protein LOC106330935 n=1 Tax=Brassica oleracea var. oleracea TaxID=109376 RepID=UPI0006A7128B|nr:PREDICTED: uncharacterized protein LOC106330935 [Brassica oleracea var. oleracea]
MEIGLPKRIAEAEAEHHVDKINNTCRLTVLGLLKKQLEDEYYEVLRDPVFGPILAINEHELGYSEKVIHSFICKMLDISKRHELWFSFARKPLRFSMQEFYAVTGLKCEEDKDTDLEA